MASFSRYIGIDYSGAETPTASLKGLRVYIADRESPPVEVMPSPSPRKYWTRRGIAGAAGGKHPGAGRHRSRVLVSIVLFRGVSLTGQPSSTISSSTGRPTTIIPTWIWSVFGNGAARMGNARWRRLTEERAGGAKSVFHLMSRDRWQNPPIRAFPGCVSSANGSLGACISGRSTVGTFHPGRL